MYTQHLQQRFTECVHLFSVMITFGDKVVLCGIRGRFPSSTIKSNNKTYLQRKTRGLSAMYLLIGIGGMGLHIGLPYYRFGESLHCARVARYF